MHSFYSCLSSLSLSLGLVIGLFLKGCPNALCYGHACVLPFFQTFFPFDLLNGVYWGMFFEFELFFASSFGVDFFLLMMVPYSFLLLWFFRDFDTLSP